MIIAYAQLFVHISIPVDLQVSLNVYTGSRPIRKIQNVAVFGILTAYVVGCSYRLSKHKNSMASVTPVADTPLRH